MKSVTNIVLVVLLCILFTMSCNQSIDKNNQNTPIKSFADYLGKPIEVDLQGKVLDHEKLPLDNTLITIGERSTLTDSLGRFSIKNASAHEELLTILIEKEGYKNEQISLTPKRNSSNITITLYKEGDLNLSRFNKFNHNLPPLIEE